MGILDSAKQVANAVQEIHNLELYERVLGLHSDIIELVEENNRLRDENKELLKTLSIKQLMTFREPFYYQDGDETPYCPACWEIKNTPVHVITRWDKSDCPVCKNAYPFPQR